MLFAAPNTPLLVSAGVPLLTTLGTGSSTTTTPPPTTFSGPTPAAISGLSGWWDAGAADAWNAVVTSLADQSGNNQAMTAYHYYTAKGATLASLITTPRLNALLGGSARRSRNPRTAQRSAMRRRSIPIPGCNSRICRSHPMPHGQGCWFGAGRTFAKAPITSTPIRSRWSARMAP